MPTSDSPRKLRVELTALQREGGDELHRAALAANALMDACAATVVGPADRGRARTHRKLPPSVSTDRRSAIVRTRGTPRSLPIRRGWPRRQGSPWSLIFAVATSLRAGRARPWCPHSTPRYFAPLTGIASSSISEVSPTSPTFRRGGLSAASIRARATPCSTRGPNSTQVIRFDRGGRVGGARHRDRHAARRAAG